jgi:RNA polymerase sigma-70 factor (ECF subfamily)
MMKNDTRILGPNHEFDTTSWSLIRAVGEVHAFDTFVRIYWKPLYFFVRQHGADNETAKDIVQEFLTTVLERGSLTKADPARGRFRTFLLAALTNFMKDRQKAASRQKRGGDQTILSLDFADGEREYALEVASGEPPEKVLHRTWARTLWKQALAELKGEPSHLEAFKLYMADVGYEEIGRRTGLTPAAAKMAVHRMKGQLKDIVQHYILQTVQDEDELQAEIAEFMGLLS